MPKLAGVEQLLPHERNPRSITPEALDGLHVSQRTFGDLAGIVWNARNGRLVAGHQRVRNLRERHGEALQFVADLAVPTTEPGEHYAAIIDPKGKAWPVRCVDWHEEKHLAAMVVANAGPIQGTWDAPQAQVLLGELQVPMGGLYDELRLGELDVDLQPLTNAIRNRQGQVGSLQERFIVPPFTVLDARQGYWQERKRAWVACGIDSAKGREHLEPTCMDTTKAGDWMHRGARKGGSLFDPVLCECIYRWFCPPGGSVLDVMAGGSVRGLVAARLGLHYTGVDLSEAQVAANKAQWEVME